MTIGTYTFYTIKSIFAIEIFGFFQYFFEFIVNFALFLCFLNKFFIFLLCKMRLCNFFQSKIFLEQSNIFSALYLVIISKEKLCNKKFLKKFMRFLFKKPLSLLTDFLFSFLCILSSVQIKNLLYICLQIYGILYLYKNRFKSF